MHNINILLKLVLEAHKPKECSNEKSAYLSNSHPGLFCIGHDGQSVKHAHMLLPTVM